MRIYTQSICDTIEISKKKSSHKLGKKVKLIQKRRQRAVSKQKYSHLQRNIF